MKTIFTLLVANFIFFQSVKAQSDLTIRMYDNSSFIVTVGTQVGFQSSSVQTIYGLQAGRYPITISRVLFANWGMPQTETVYFGIVEIPHSVAISVVLDWNNSLKIEQIVVKNGYLPGFPNVTIGYAYGMDPISFVHLQKTLAKESFESTKVLMLKQALDGRVLNSMQLSQLLEDFSFDSNRLEVAKYGCRMVVDPANYYLIFSVFTFSSSKEELANFIR